VVNAKGPGQELELGTKQALSHYNRKKIRNTEEEVGVGENNRLVKTKTGF